MTFRFLLTPRKSSALVIGIWLLILLAPAVNVIHFMARGARGDYPWYADSIGIPIFSHLLFIYPFELWALRGLKSYREGVSLFYFSRKNWGFALLSTIATVWPFGLLCVGMMEDGIHARYYATTIFYTLRLYAFLLLRVAMMLRHEAPDRPSIFFP